MLNIIVVLLIVLSGTELSNRTSSLAMPASAVSNRPALSTPAQPGTLTVLLNHSNANHPLTRAEANAIRWFKNRIGHTNYEGWCELAVERAFGTEGVFDNPRENWGTRHKHFPFSKAPRGALVFYNTSASGHVAISLGDGRIISTSVGGKIGIARIDYFQNPIGWAYARWR